MGAVPLGLPPYCIIMYYFSAFSEKQQAKPNKAHSIMLSRTGPDSAPKNIRTGLQISMLYYHK
jgi:hypothetical protein